MSLAALSEVFEHINSGGMARFYGLGNTTRYHKAPNSDLVDAGFSNLISSATIFKPSTGGGSLVLFKPFLFNLNTDYAGPFLQITNLQGAADISANMTDFNFNDATTSLLFIGIKRAPEFRVSFRSIFLQKWKDVIDAQLAGSQASREGDPLLTWEMFPVGISYLDSSLTYLKVHQPLHISIDWWPDYEASITYHIFLFIDGNGHLAGFVARWAYWVEGGIKSGGIADKLKPKVIAGMDTLNTELANQLKLISGFKLTDLYYLPGNQTGGSSRGVISGTTLDDVTIVAQL